MNRPQKNGTEDASNQYRDLGLAMSIPFMLASGPIIGWLIGKWLDARFGTNWLTLTMLALGFIAGVRSVIRTLREDLYVPPIFRDASVKGGSNGTFAIHDEGGFIGEDKCDKTKIDALEVDGVIVGTVSYSSRRRDGAIETLCEDDCEIFTNDSKEMQCDSQVVSTENSITSAEIMSNKLAQRKLVTLPNIIASGLWITLLLAGVIAVFIDTETALGLLASGLWNLVNFATLWLTFKTAFSKHPMRVFFTLPLVCIKIPLLYSLVVALYALKLFDPLGLTLGLLALPAVILFLAILDNRN